LKKKDTNDAREEHSRKHRILDAAENRILLQGYAATTMGEICEDVGVTKGALFHHFPSKEALFRQVLGRWIEKKLAPASFALDPQLESEPLNKLRRLFDALVAQYQSIEGEPPGCLIGLFAMEKGLVNHPVRNECSRAFRLLQSSIEKELRAAKEMRERNALEMDSLCPDGLATVCVAAIQGALLLTRVSPDKNELERVVEELWNCIEKSYS